MTTLRDRLRPPRADLAEPQVAAPRQRESHLQDQLVGREGGLPVLDEEVVGRDLALAALPTDEDHGIGREEDRQRVAGR